MRPPRLRQSRNPRSRLLVKVRLLPLLAVCVSGDQRIALWQLAQSVSNPKYVALAVAASLGDVL